MSPPPAIRAFRDSDVPALVRVLCEEEELSFERVPPPAEEAERRLRAVLPLQAGDIWLVAMAEDGRCLGFAAAFRVFPGREIRPMWYLKQLYVAASERSLGIGERLMRELARTVIDRGGSRLEFSTGSGNAGAIRFYERLGIAVLPKVFYRLEPEALETLAGTGPGAGHPTSDSGR